MISDSLNGIENAGAGLMTAFAGNAVFYSFIELIPQIADKAGIDPIMIALPMQLTSNIIRAASPVAAVVIIVSSGGLSNRIKSLEAKGLLTREQSTGDGREVILRATKAGRDVALKAAASHMKLEREMLQGFPDEDAGELPELLRRLILLQEEPLNKDGRK